MALLCTLSTLGFSQTLTPEALWKIGRVSDPRISPDGKSVIYNVRLFDIASNKGQSDLYLIPAGGGTPVALANTSADEGSARWRPDGKKNWVYNG